MSDNESDDAAAGLSDSPGKRPTKKAKTNLYSVPSAEEISDLTETEQLFKSNLFKLQLEELLKEVRIEKKKTQKLEGLLHHLKGVLDSLPTRTVNIKPNTTILGSQLEFFTERNLEMRFEAPARVDLVGSYLLNTTLKADFNVDITIQIPNGCLQPKDFTNHRYFDKRRVYLQVVKKALGKDEKFAGNVKVAYLNGDKHKPILVLAPFSGGSLKRALIRVIPCIDPTCFPAHKLNLDRCCVKNQADASGSSNSIATPYYNQQVMEDAHFRTHLTELHSSVSNCPELAHAIMLLKVWGRQRQFGGRTESNSAHDSFNGFLLSMVMAHLMLIRKVTKSMSSYQMFRTAVLYLATGCDLSKNGVAMKAEENAKHIADLQACTKAFDVSFMDRSGLLNLAFRVSKSSYERLKLEAKSAVTYLDSALEDGFADIFMKSVDFTVQYDQYILVTLPDKKSTNCKSLYGRYPTLEHPYALARRTHEVLKRALGPRVSLIDIRVVCNGSALAVGLALDPDHSHGILEIGPSAEDKEASSDFRKFWGPKSQLRRFKDSRIVEVISWEADVEQPQAVVPKIVKYILQRHLKIQETDIGFVGDQFDSLMLYRPPTRSSEFLLPEPWKSLQPLNAAFDRLSQIIKQLNLPLSFLQFQPVHPALRNTAAFPPLPVSLDDLSHESPADAMEPVEIVAQFEGSSKWPDDLAAISRIKSAFYIQIGSLLREQHSIPSSVGLDFVDCVLDGFAFRLVIYHDREVLIHKADAREAAEIEMARSGRPMEQIMSGPAFNMERDLVHRPYLASSMKGFSHRFARFGPITSMVKRWVNAHMMSGCLREEAIELLVASTFTKPEPYSAPTTPFAGLLRFLRLLATHDFEKEPIIVDILGEFTQETYTSIQGAFEAARSKGPNPVMYIATKKDPDSIWTRQEPTTVMLRRLVAFAKSSLTHFHTLLQQSVSSSNGVSLCMKKISNPALWYVASQHIIFAQHVDCLRLATMKDVETRK